MIILSLKEKETGKNVINPVVAADEDITSFVSAYLTEDRVIVIDNIDTFNPNNWIYERTR